MNDDILLYDESISEDFEVLRTDPVIETDIDRIIEDSKKESISNNFIVEDSLYERQQIDKSNDVILLNNVNNNNSSCQSINLENYDQVTLWTNSNPNINFNSTELLFNENLYSYDLIGVEYCYSTNSNLVSLFIIPRSVISSLSGSPYNALGLSDYDGNWYNRQVSFHTGVNKISISSCLKWPNTLDDSKCIPLHIYGYNSLTLSNNDIPNQIVSGNNIYNFNYYCGVSENSVSNDIIHKPLSEYNTIESLGLYSFMIALGILFYLLIRRAVFKWR